MTNQEIGGLLQTTSHTRTNKYICRYCEKSVEQKYMTSVPTTPEIREKWMEILGPLFAENVNKYDQSGSYFGRICLTHFRGNITHRNKYELPIRMDEEHVENEQEGTIIDKPSRKRSIFRECLYCEKRLIQDKTTRVPSNPTVREKWIQILGARFAANLEKIKHACICLTHFKGNIEKRLKHQLPIRINEEKEEGKGKEKEQSDEEEKEEGVHENPGFNNSLGNIPKNEKEDHQVEIIQRNNYEELGNMDNENPINGQVEDLLGMDNDVVEMENNELLTVKREEQGQIFETNQSIGMDLVANSTEQYENRQNCRICEIELESSIKTIEIPTNTDEFIKWLKVFGENLRENVFKYTEPHFICMSHIFEKNWENC